MRITRYADRMSKVRLPDGFVDELKARLKPSDVIGRKVKLNRQGKEWVGLSPFTNEKTPSFYVNDSKGIFKDFSSGLGGDVIKFVQETERLSFMEAVERLAEEAGLELPKASAEDEARFDRLARLKQACGAASAFFQARLHATEGAAAREYLEQKRGLGADAWARWGIGLAPDDWRELRTHLKREGYSDDELVAAGLIKRSDKGGEPYDVFRNRIMFPIADVRGDIIAFGGRALDPEDKAKYLNSPETELFHKSRVLYNYKRARESINYGERGGLIVCEGYMDVIALGEAGIAGAVAPLGTAMTDQQLDMLWRAGPDPIVCLDGDAAGLRAAQRAVSVALPKVEPDRSVYFCLLPDGMDPDDLIRQANGPARMREALGGAIPLIEMLWQRERDAEPIDTPERKAGLEARLKAAAASIAHTGVRAAYERDLIGRMREHFWALSGARKRQDSSRFDSGVRKKGDSYPGLGLLIRAIDTPSLATQYDEQICFACFNHPVVRQVRDVLVALVDVGEEINRQSIQIELEKNGYDKALSVFKKFTEGNRTDSHPVVTKDWMVGLEAFFPEARLESADSTSSAIESSHKRARIGSLSWSTKDVAVYKSRARDAVDGSPGGSGSEPPNPYEALERMKALSLRRQKAKQ